MTGLRTLVLGFGAIASGLGRDEKMARYFDFACHAQALAAHPGFDWRGVVDPAPSAQADARDNWQVPQVTAEVADAVQAVRPEVVILAAPPGARAAAVAAMPDLKAVLLEKPLSGPEDNDGDDLAAICAERNIPVLVNYWRRADRLSRTLASGGLVERIGRPQAVFGLYGKGLANNCSHMIDFVRMLIGEVATVQALGPARAAADSSVPGDQALPFALTLEDGQVASFGTVDFAHYREVGLDIWGETGRLQFLLEGLSTTVFPRAENRGLENADEISPDAGEMLEPTVTDSLYRIYDNLAAVALGSATPWSPLSSALVNARIVDRILQSAAEDGRRLTVD